MQETSILAIGDLAPDFQCPDQDGRLHQLSDYRGKKVILFFYPKADTPGCTAESCNLRDNYDLLMEKGFAILGVSADKEISQKKFSEKYKFQFPLLADTDKSIIKAYGVWGQKKFMGKAFDGILRTTYIIGETGKIEKVFTKVETKSHATQILNEYKS